MPRGQFRFSRGRSLPEVYFPGKLCEVEAGLHDDHVAHSSHPLHTLQELLYLSCVVMALRDIKMLQRPTDSPALHSLLYTMPLNCVIHRSLCNACGATYDTDTIMIEMGNWVALIKSMFSLMKIFLLLIVLKDVFSVLMGHPLLTKSTIVEKITIVLGFHGDGTLVLGRSPHTQKCPRTVCFSTRFKISSFVLKKKLWYFGTTMVVNGIQERGYK